MSDMNRPEPQSISRASAVSGLPAHEVQIDDWAAMGKAFEGFCKAGLALTVGFSVAAAFCKMMDAKNVNIPNVVNKLASTVFNPHEETRNDKPR